MTVWPGSRALARTADGETTPAPAPPAYRPHSAWYGPGRLPGSGPPRPDGDVSPLWRAIVLVAVISLFISIDIAWRAEALVDRLAAIGIIVGFAGILSCAVAAVTLRGAAAMRRLELGVLGVAVLLFAAELPQMFPAVGRAYSGDEGTLTDLAGAALRRGSDPYALSWPFAFHNWDSGFTITLSGHVVNRFEYPPVTVVLNALAAPFTRAVPTAGVVAIAVLMITAVLMFFLLPSPWRTAAPMICLGIGLYAAPARRGDATIVALPLLMLALYRWTSIGNGGRLGRTGWISAVCLGLAAATQQLTWFLAPFLVAAIYLIRRGDLPMRASARLACAYTAIAATAFAVVNIPFAIWNFGDWLRGISAPLAQGAIPLGQGLIGITYFLSGGSGALDFYNYAALLYAVALFTCFVFFFRRLGPAVTILPWTIFFFSIRAQETYYFLLVALFVVSLLTTDPAVIDHAHQLGGRLRQRLRPGAPARALAVTALFLPTAACLAVAMGAPQPLKLTIASRIATGPEHIISGVTVTATNTSGQAVTPHFALSTGSATTAVWIIESGPRTLPPGGTATYVIDAPSAAAARSTRHRIELRVFSADPSTLSSVLVAPGSPRPFGS
jgi:uncharacterized membrane protein